MNTRRQFLIRAPFGFLGAAAACRRDPQAPASASAGTPPAVIAKLNKALNDAVSTPEAKEDLRKRGFVAMGGTPQQLADWLKIQEPIWVPILQAAGIKPE